MNPARKKDERSLNASLPQARDAAAQLLQYAVSVSALSGVFLLLAYVSGRIYLQAYFSVFGAEVNSLGLSVQDVMFASWRSLLPAITGLGAILLAGILFLRLGRVIDRSRQALETIGVLSTELLDRRERLVGELNALEEQAAEPGEVDRIHRDLEAPKAQTESMSGELDALNGEVDLVRTDIDSNVSPIMMKAAELLDSIPLSRVVFDLFLVALLAAALAISVGLSMPREGWRSALLGGGITLMSGTVTMVVYWIGYSTLLAQHKWSPRKGIMGAGAVLVFVISVMPWIAGTLAGHADRNTTDPDGGLPAIVLVSDHLLNPNWREINGVFVSPDLRRIGQNSSFIIVWDPASPSHTIQFPIERIIRVERQ